MSEWLPHLIGLALSMAALGAWIAPQKGRGVAEGLVLGLFFGPLGVVVECLLPSLAPAPARASRPPDDEDDDDDLPRVIPAAPPREDRRREVPRAIDGIEL